MRLSVTKDSAWEEKEAAILALGAVAEGCIKGLLPHLAQVRELEICATLTYFMVLLFGVGSAYSW